MDQCFDVIVAGAGPAGLATGSALCRRGHRVLVLEARKLFQPEKIWLTFGEVARRHKLEDAVRLWCDRGYLMYYTGEPLAVVRKDLVAIFDECRLLRLLAARIRNDRVTLEGECPVTGLRRNSNRPSEISVQTPKGEFTCNILVDATGGHLQWDRLSNLSTAYYTTYARIYEGCTPRLPLNEIVLLHKAYPGRGMGQWSTPISADQYLLGEVNFSTRRAASSVDFEKDKVGLSERLDNYTWRVQNFVVVPQDTPFREYYGVVPVRRPPPGPRDNILTVGDSGFQARPFFGVSIDQLLDQAEGLADAATSCFETGDFSAAKLRSFSPQPGTQEILNFQFGLLVWRILEVGPDNLGGQLCSALRQLDPDVKYNLLRARLKPRELATVLRLLRKHNFFYRLGVDSKTTDLMSYLWACVKLTTRLLLAKS